MQSCPELYGFRELSPLRRPEVERGREHIDHPWHNLPGDEWLVANPVEVEGVCEALATCMPCYIGEDDICLPRSQLLELPAEIMDQILSFLDASDVSTVANTCRRLYNRSQSYFKAYITRNMSWLWELLENDQYPPSPDWPATWDPLCPPGLTPPSLPVGLESKEDEDDRWTQIILDDPEMEEVGNATRALNDLRREEIFRPYRARQEASLREWQDFRAGVEAWIRHLPDAAKAGHDVGSLDWIRIWRVFNPAVTRFQGVRNRARIWGDCERILDDLKKAHEEGELDAEREALSTKLSSSEYWNEVHAG